MIIHFYGIYLMLMIIMFNNNYDNYDNYDEAINWIFKNNLMDIISKNKNKKYPVVLVGSKCELILKNLL